MKELKISGKNIKVQKGAETIKVNGTSLEKMISESLPEDMKNYEDYLGDIEISINIHDGGELKTETNYSEDNSSC